MKEQILALAVQSGFKLDWAISNCTGQFESFYHAAIESYKAELLKEAGEPVAEVIWFDPALELFPSKQPHKIIDGSMSFMDSSKIGTKLFTSDQLAAAILKATGPLEKEIERLKVDRAKKQKESVTIFDANCTLRAQLAAAQEEIERLRIALDCTKTDLVRMRCPDFFEGVKGGYETLFDGHLVNMIGLINNSLNKSDLQKFSEQSGLQVDGRSEFAYTDRLEHFPRLVRLDSELEIDDLKDQLAKAEQLWQIAQGRCDGLEEKLAKAEQRVAEWQPIETAPKDKEVFIGAFIDGEFHFGKAVCFYERGNEFEGEFYSGWYWSIDDVSESVAENPTHWTPLPPAPAIASINEK